MVTHLQRVLFLPPLIMLTLTLCAFSTATSHTTDQTTESIVAEIEDLLADFQLPVSLERVDAALQQFPANPSLHRLRGDILMLARRDQEALAAYHQTVLLAPNWLVGQWARWGLLNRIRGGSEHSLLAMKQIARIDERNPLAQIRFARELRKHQRLEESRDAFRRAVTIAPTHMAFRLYLAHASFDLLDTDAARQEVLWILAHASPRSPEWVTARDFLAIIEGDTLDKGTRSDFFASTKKPYGETGKDYRAWALLREQALQLMKDGKHQAAEATLRDALVLDPEDDWLRYKLGRTLMNLERCEEAIVFFRESVKATLYPHFYPDAVFRLGQCLARLGKGEQAIPYFERVLAIQGWQKEYFYSLYFPNLSDVHIALDEATAHRSSAPRPSPLEPILQPILQDNIEGKDQRHPAALPHPPAQRMPRAHEFPQQVMPLSMDMVQGWFRYFVTAKAAIRDTWQTGFHEHIPLNPTDTFAPSQPAIYLIFALTSSPPDLTQVTSQWVAERVGRLPQDHVVGTDAVLMELNDTTGYFVLQQPEGGWPIGMYRVDLFVGEEISATNLVADIRFRIVPAQHQPSAKD